MQFSHLQSLVVLGKANYTPKSGASLHLAQSRQAPYVEPTLRKEIFEQEKPSVILISAVGATGKSTLAQVLASTGGLPLLDLSKHKAVGDNTISGLLTNSFLPSELGGVFGGLKDGTYGIVIDGLDEGRSKTTEQSFEAFLDDIVSLCSGAPRPTFVILGRTDIVDSTWLYLATKGVSVGLLSIAPFDRTQAHEYIDKVSQASGTPHSQQYANARDAVLNCLSAAFANSPVEDGQGSFLSFIGYPPVLDAVATVLKEDRNFFRLETEIAASVSGDREIELLTRISSVILEREQRDKVWANILSGMCESFDTQTRERIRVTGFGVEEQCIRLLAFCLGRTLEMNVFHDKVLDTQFEKHLSSFFPEHPFVTGKGFRNAVFEAYCVATAFLSGNAEYQALAMEYTEAFRSTYHLVYMCFKLAKGRSFPLGHIRALIAAALDFRSRSSSVELEIDGLAARYSPAKLIQHVQVNVTISRSITEDVDVPRGSRDFAFVSDADNSRPIDLGAVLADTLIFLPHEVTLKSASEIKLIAPVALFCKHLSLESPSLSVSAATGKSDTSALFDAEYLTSQLQSISVVGSTLEVVLEETSGIGYPLVAHLKKIPDDGFDPDFKAKYLRLRKILTQFRSHSKGQLAKYADKVENERVAGNETGAAILEKLLSDKILVKNGKFYFIEPEQLDLHLGIDWIRLRSGVVNQKLAAYLQDIPL